MNKINLINEVLKKDEKIIKKLSTSKEIYEYAKSKNLADSKQSWMKFVYELKNMGVDFYNIKENENNMKWAHIKSLTSKSLTFTVDGNFKTNKYAIVDKNGLVVEYGSFFEKTSTIAEAKIQSAMRALVIAKKFKEEENLEALQVNLLVSEKWMLNQDNNRQNAYILTKYSLNNNLDLNLEYIPIEENEANKHTSLVGYQKFHMNHLKEIWSFIENNNEIDKTKMFEPKANTKKTKTTKIEVEISENNNDEKEDLEIQ